METRHVSGLKPLLTFVDTAAHRGARNPHTVIPAKAGIHFDFALIDPSRSVVSTTLNASAMHRRILRCSNPIAAETIG
jgi:hypothetical protein